MFAVGVKEDTSYWNEIIFKAMMLDKADFLESGYHVDSEKPRKQRSSRLSRQKRRGPSDSPSTDRRRKRPVEEPEVLSSSNDEDKDSLDDNMNEPPPSLVLPTPTDHQGSSASSGQLTEPQPSTTP